MAAETVTATAAVPHEIAEISERPRLAAGVRLVGEFRDSGFAEPQWLIERDGQFVQVTALLYRLAEQLDGRTAIDQIAERLTTASDWLVTPDDVRYLVASRLAPLRLIDGSDAGGQSAARDGSPAAPSAFNVNLRTKTVGPRVIEPVTGVLRHLFAPPIVLLVLSATVIGEVWLYRSGVLFGAFVDAFNTPGFLLIAIGLVLIGAAFHELGHASALRYGGGQARAIGAGFYLVFPVFYTDVTDSYRLGRWARVRTGLGGIYFHLLFVLVLIGAALVLDQRFLLVAVLLINLEIVRQFVPFVRLDGYWVLTDLTGIPDFFSQMEPFVRSLLPAGVRGVRLPKLKPWAKAVFALYVGLIVPGLASLLFLIVERTPQIAGALWDAMTTQVGLLSSAWSDGDPLAAATSVVQVAILGISALGTVYVFAGLAWKLARASSRLANTGRRAAALAGVAAVSTLVAAQWAGQPW